MGTRAICAASVLQEGAAEKRGVSLAETSPFSVVLGEADGVLRADKNKEFMATVG